MELCNCTFNRNEFKDIDGCLKSHGHSGEHVFKNERNELIAWHYDYKCECGCWDDYENGNNDQCIIYWEVDKI